MRGLMKELDDAEPLMKDVKVLATDVQTFIVHRGCLPPSNLNYAVSVSQWVMKNADKNGDGNIGIGGCQHFSVSGGRGKNGMRSPLLTIIHGPSRRGARTGPKQVQGVLRII